MNAIPALDGIRAVSFLIVFVAHAGLAWIVPGGFGCTVFFFLSGFLITTLMRGEWARSGQINIREFYLRRVLRILPPLYLTMAALVGVAFLGGLNQTPQRQLEFVPTLYQIFHFSNYFIIGNTDLNLIEGSSPLWSLAVEMHFYFIYPFVFIFMMQRRFSASAQALTLGGLCLAILAWRCVLVYGMGAPEIRTYMGSDTRMDSMLFGCILGVYHNPVIDPVRLEDPKTKFAALFGAAHSCSSAACLFRDPGFRETLRYSLQGLALIPVFYLAVVDHERPWFRWLDFGPVRYVGWISYSLYLCHKSFINMVENLWPGGPQFAIATIALVISLLFSVAMYKLVEQPIARVRKNMRAAARSSGSALAASS